MTDDRTIVHVKRHGKKFKLVFCFTARQITRIMTAEQITALEGKGYKLVPSPIKGV